MTRSRGSRAARVVRIVARRCWRPVTAAGLVLVVLAACGGATERLNPEGYPPIPGGRAPEAAPPAGGSLPTPAGAGMSPGGGGEQAGQAGPGERGRQQAGVSALGPGAGDPGIYEAMNGSGDARAGPTAIPTQTPRPVATVTITGERGFEPAHVTIRRGEAVRWTNRARSPQTVTGDPGWALDRSRVALPRGAEPWTSGALNSGDDFVKAFDVEGEYMYVSTTLERQGVTGRVTVRP